MSTPTSEESAVNRNGSFGYRVKNLLRSPSQKSNERTKESDLQHRVRVRTDPKLVQVSDEPVRPHTPIKALLAELPIDDETKVNPSSCQTDEGVEPPFEEGDLEIFYTSNVSNVTRSVQPVFAVPVNTSPRKEEQEPQEDTRSAGTQSTSSSSDTPQRDSPSSYFSHHEQRNDADDSQTDESMSLLTFDTLRSATRTISPTNELSYDGVVGVIGSIVDQQWRAFEKSITCEEADTQLDKINEVDEDIVTSDGLEYAPSDHEHVRIQGHSMDTKVSPGVTTPSAGTRVISNSPNKQEKKGTHDDGYTANLLSDDDESLNEAVEEEDQLVYSPHVVMRRVCSEIIQHINPSAEPTPTRSTRDTDDDNSILNILKDLSLKEDEFSYMRDVVSVPSNSISVNDTASLPKDRAYPNVACWEMLDFKICQPDQFCVVEETHEEELVPVETLISDEVVSEEKGVSEPLRTKIQDATVAAADNIKPIPPSLPRRAETPKSIEESSNPSLEQTVEYYEEIVEALEKYNSYRGWDSMTDKEKDGRSACLFTSSRGLLPSSSLVQRTAKCDSNEPKNIFTAKPTVPVKIDHTTSTDSKKIQPLAINKKRSFFGILFSSAKARHEEEDQMQSRPEKRSGKKARKQEKPATKMSDFLQIRCRKKAVATLDRSISRGSTAAVTSPSRGRSMPPPLRRNRSAPSYMLNEPAGPTTHVPKHNISATRVVSKRGDKKTLNTSTKKKSKISVISKANEVEVRKKSDEKPLRIIAKTSGSVTKQSPVLQIKRKVAFSRTPLIMQRFQTSRGPPLRQNKKSHKEDISLLLDENKGLSLKTSSWLDDEVSDQMYLDPRPETPVLMTSHSIPQKLTCPPSVQHLYAQGNREFEDFY